MKQRLENGHPRELRSGARPIRRVIPSRIKSPCSPFVQAKTLQAGDPAARLAANANLDFPCHVSGDTQSLSSATIVAALSVQRDGSRR